MAKVTYTALLESGEDGIGVSFPDLPGCVSWGVDAGEAVRNAEEALAFHLEGMAEDGEEIPDPTHLGVLIEAAYADRGQPVTYAAITVEAPPSGERVNVYLSRALLRSIDNYCAEFGVNRSAFFAAAAKAQLRALRPLKAAADAQRQIVATRVEEALAGLEPGKAHEVSKAVAAALIPTKHG